MRFWPSLLSLLGVILLWAFLSRLTPAAVLPSPIEVTREWFTNAKGIGAEVRVTGTTALRGFATALVVTFGLIVSFRLSAAFRSTVYPLVLLSQLTPKIAVLPLIILFLSPPNAKVLIAATICYFPMLESFELGIKEVPSPLRDYFLLLKATKWKTFVKLELPHAIPFLLSAAKVSFVFAVIGAVTAELIYPTEGIGYIIMAASNSYSAPLVFCGIVTATLIGASGWMTIGLFERLTIRVFYKYKRSARAVPS